MLEKHRDYSNAQIVGMKFNCHEESNWIHEIPCNLPLNCEFHVIYHWKAATLVPSGQSSKEHNWLAEQWGVICSDKSQTQVYWSN